MLVNRRTLRIEWGQCDPAGIVFYPQYLLIFDTSTGWLFERTGLKPLAMRRKYGIVGMPIVEVGAKFVMPCRFDDEVVVESEVSEWGRTSFTVRHRVLKEGQLVTVKLVAIDERGRLNLSMKQAARELKVKK